MKRFILSILLICIIFSSCDRKSIHYNGPDVINIVLQEEYNIKATSRDPIQYHSDDEMFVTVSDNGVIFGKNVGEANVKLSNTENELNIPVIVNLFEEPTLNFYCNQSYIEKLYGTPRFKNDSILIYGSGNEWFSYAVWEMDFFFINDKYVESNLYIRNDLDIRIDDFLKENYSFKGNITDTINNKIQTYEIYLNNDTLENASVLIGKLKDVGPYNDICLFYIPYKHSRGSDYKDVICRDRKRMKN